ncbi:hypothetical protein K0C01_05965 [Salinarchaeum sp. IM2453]|uniref:hypothetical protein n=1 Tax=Salinarchaeum sp. IM2453 TaxID=2862870 RepID=UPI001C83D730|nr:hypothetical protein [Salinarchaeum sp. IM2453]QZA89664.1 hypothetical protein K0C01_05965 [Salinarchaeum sp. IM2453]
MLAIHLFVRDFDSLVVYFSAWLPYLPTGAAAGRCDDTGLQLLTDSDLLSEASVSR